MKLYSYWRSTASYRVRIALNLKGIDYDISEVDLTEGCGQQHTLEYDRINPAHTVPTLVLSDGTALSQSIAIIEYLDAVYPNVALLPDDPKLRANVVAASHLVVMDIHPINNLRVIQYLEAQFKTTEMQKVKWMQHWIENGFTALEKMVHKDTAFSFGPTPLLSDICIAAQLYNARRWGVDLSPFGRLREIDNTCLHLPTFQAAAPQPQQKSA